MRVGEEDKLGRKGREGKGKGEGREGKGFHHFLCYSLSTGFTPCMICLPKRFTPYTWTFRHLDN